MSGVAITVLDHDRSIVVAHAGLGQRECGRAEGALGRNPADQPLGAAAAGAVIHLMLTIYDVIAASGRIVPHLQVTESRN